MAILSSKQSKAARQALGLSQSKVAKDTGLNRTTLGLFEVNKYLLDDQTLSNLRDYYESLGHSFGAMPMDISPLPPPVSMSPPPKAPEESQARVMDSFLVAAGLDAAKVEDILAEIAENDKRIQELGAQTIKRDLFGDPYLEARDEIIRLLAQNYQNVRTLQGHDLIPSAANDDGTIWDLVRAYLSVEISTKPKFW